MSCTLVDFNYFGCGCFIQLLDVSKLICLTGYFKARCLIEILPCLWLKRMDLMPTDHAILVRTTWGRMDRRVAVAYQPVDRPVLARVLHPIRAAIDTTTFLQLVCPHQLHWWLMPSDVYILQFLQLQSIMRSLSHATPSMVIAVSCYLLPHS